MKILSVFSARILLSLIPFIPTVLVSAGNAPSEAEMLLILPGQEFRDTVGFYNFLNDTIFTWNEPPDVPEFGKWSYELLSADVGKLTLTYDEDGYDPELYREEITLNFSDPASTVFEYQEYEYGQSITLPNSRVVDFNNPAGGPSVDRTGQAFLVGSGSEYANFYFLSERLVLAFYDDDVDVEPYQSTSNFITIGGRGYDLFEIIDSSNVKIGFAEYDFVDESFFLEEPALIASYSKSTFANSGYIDQALNGSVFDSFSANTVGNPADLKIDTIKSFNFAVDDFDDIEGQITIAVRDGALRFEKVGDQPWVDWAAVEALSIYELDKRFFIETEVAFGGINDSTRVGAQVHLEPTDLSIYWDEKYFSWSFGVAVDRGTYLLEISQYTRLLGGDNGYDPENSVYRSMQLDIPLGDPVRLLITHDPEASTLYFEYANGNSAQTDGGGLKSAFDLNYGTGTWTVFDAAGAVTETISSLALSEVVGAQSNLNSMLVNLAAYFPTDNGNESWQGAEVQYLEYAASVETFPVAFEPMDYLMLNPDVEEAFGTDYNAAWEHYLNVGVTEGRTHSVSFSIDDYLSLNGDLAAAFGSDKKAALKHWFNYGMNEGRQAFVPLVTWPSGFSPSDYLGRYSDLAEAFGTDYNAAWEHYLNVGVTEGRSHSGSFSIDDYLSLNGDLAAAFGSDKKAALEHWFNYGINEGRQAFVPLVTWPSGFSPEDYLARYADLAAAFGADYNKAWEHYLNDGVTEGRTHSVSFSIDDYLSLNGDLAAAFGSDKKAALEHWFNYGINEGRQALVSWPSGFTPQDYLARYNDLAVAFGADYNKAWEHYLNDGVTEGRTHSVSFSIDDYLSLNGDLAAAFGSDKKAALEHWFNYGINEGRQALRL